jgi:hypothetical protein
MVSWRIEEASKESQLKAAAINTIMAKKLTEGGNNLVMQ